VESDSYYVERHWPFVFSRLWRRARGLGSLAIFRHAAIYLNQNTMTISPPRLYPGARDASIFHVFPGLSFMVGNATRRADAASQCTRFREHG
jgi:hypothetical protein